MELNLYAHNKTSCQSVRPSLFEIFESVKLQVEFLTLAEPTGKGYSKIDPLYDELCLVISEIYAMNPDTIIRIAGTETEVRLVQEVYARLKNEHIRVAFENIQSQNKIIHNKKAYARTVLYNTVFEIEMHFASGV